MESGMNPGEIIIKLLVKANIISANFTGRIVFNIGSGGLCDVERWDKIRINEHSFSDQEKIFVDRKISPGYNFANNMA